MAPSVSTCMIRTNHETFFKSPGCARAPHSNSKFCDNYSVCEGLRENTPFLLRTVMLTLGEYCSFTAVQFVLLSSLRHKNATGKHSGISGYEKTNHKRKVENSFQYSRLVQLSLLFISWKLQDKPSYFVVQVRFNIDSHTHQQLFICCRWNTELEAETDALN